MKTCLAALHTSDQWLSAHPFSLALCCSLPLLFKTLASPRFALLHSSHLCLEPENIRLDSPSWSTWVALISAHYISKLSSVQLAITLESSCPFCTSSCGRCMTRALTFCRRLFPHKLIVAGTPFPGSSRYLDLHREHILCTNAGVIIMGIS